MAVFNVFLAISEDQMFPTTPQLPKLTHSLVIDFAPCYMQGGCNAGLIVQYSKGYWGRGEGASDLYSRVR